MKYRLGLIAIGTALLCLAYTSVGIASYMQSQSINRSAGSYADLTDQIVESRDFLTTNSTSYTLAVTAVGQHAKAQAGEAIPRWVVAGGGSLTATGSYSLLAVVGQGVIGPVTSGSYGLIQGYLASDASVICCTGTTGNVNNTGIVDLSDLSALVSYLTGGGYALPCVEEANVNNAGIVDLADLSALVSYLTGGGYVLPNCP